MKFFTARVRRKLFVRNLGDFNNERQHKNFCASKRFSGIICFSINNEKIQVKNIFEGKKNVQFKLADDSRSESESSRLFRRIC